MTCIKQQHISPLPFGLRMQVCTIHTDIHRNITQIKDYTRAPAMCNNVHTSAHTQVCTYS
jgi:hypothetical protein